MKGTKISELTEKANRYVEALCQVKPNRRTGSRGNQQAVEFFADMISPFAIEVDTMPFKSLDYTCSGVELSRNNEKFDIYNSPYSKACDITSTLIPVSTAEELERKIYGGKLLLMKGNLCSEQLAPKNFIFYNPDHHKRIIGLLEEKRPAGIITATGKKPDQAGALDPFPLIVDGDFDIPSVYCREAEGERLAAKKGQVFRLKIDARRITSSAANIIAKLNNGKSQKIVVTAHIDAYEDSPGAADNAAGVAVLLLAAELLSGYSGKYTIEIAALNGEDHYSAGGQMDYLTRYQHELSDIKLVINIDDAGYKHGRTAFSFYECPPGLQDLCQRTFAKFSGLVPGPPWFMGDHMIFVQKGIPALAFASENMEEFMRTAAHTSLDTPDIVDCRRIVETALSIHDVIKAL